MRVRTLLVLCLPAGFAAVWAVWLLTRPSYPWYLVYGIFAPLAIMVNLDAGFFTEAVVAIDGPEVESVPLARFLIRKMGAKAGNYAQTALLAVTLLAAFFVGMGLASALSVFYFGALWGDALNDCLAWWLKYSPQARVHLASGPSLKASACAPSPSLRRAAIRSWLGLAYG